VTLVDTRFHTILLMASNSPDLNPVDYSVPHMHSEYGWAKTLVGSGVSRAGPQTYYCSYWTVAMPS